MKQPANISDKNDYPKPISIFEAIARQNALGKSNKLKINNSEINTNKNSANQEFLFPVKMLF